MGYTEKIKKTRYMQYLSGIAGMISVSSIGMSTAWASPSLPLLQSEDSPVGRPITDEEGSWIVSSYLLASIPITVVGSWTVDKFGRRKSLLYTALLSLTQWILTIFAESVELLIVARCFGGMAMGIAIMTAAIYNGEITEPDIRGKISTYLMLMKIIGSLIVLSIGPYISYTALGIVCAAGPIVFFCSFYFMPESPYYLVKIGDYENAKRNLIRLSSNTVNDEFIEKRILHIQQTVETDMANNTGTIFELFTRKYAFLIFLLFGIKTLQQFAGANALEGYLQTIIELTDSGLSPEVSSIIIGFIQLPAVYISGLLVDRLGRKPLLITSAIGCAIALFGEGTYFYIQDYLEEDTSSLAWLPTSALALFWIMNSVGIFTLPYVLLGELFPTNIKGIAVATASVYGGIAGFLVTKFFKPLSNAAGIYTMFFVFAGICVAGAIFVFVFLPETKGKDFDEIQKSLQSRKVHIGCKNNKASRKQDS